MPAALDDWHRFGFYARRVHRLEIDWTRDCRYIMFLADQNSGLSPFLKLKCVSFAGTVQTLSRPLRFDVIFGRALRELKASVNRESSGPELFPSLSYLPKSSPDLRILDLYLHSDIAMKRLEGLLEQLPHLQKFVLMSFAGSPIGRVRLSRKLIAVLATMKHLSSFTTSFDSCETFCEVSQSERPFPALRWLEVRVGNDGAFSSWTSFIRSYKLTSLTTLLLTYSPGSSFWERTSRLPVSKMLVQSIDNVVSHTTLTRLDLSCCFSPFEVLRPLLSFVNLRW